MDNSKAPGKIICSRKDASKYSTPEENGISGRGIVVPGTLIDGGSPAFDPHRVTTVIIDPSEDGRGGLEIDLTDVSKADCSIATDNGRALRKTIAGSDAALDAAHNSFVRLGEICAKKRASKIEDVETEEVVQEDFVRAKSQSIIPTRASLPRPRPSFEDKTPVPPPAPVIPEPNMQVEFDIDGNIIESWYHDVIFSNDLLVLIYDKRYKGTLYMPPRMLDHAGNPKMMLIDVLDHTNAYAVSSFGFTFHYGTCDFCVLLVDKVAPKE